jgi:hypothetical protein
MLSKSLTFACCGCLSSAVGRRCIRAGRYFTATGKYEGGELQKVTDSATHFHFENTTHPISLYCVDVKEVDFLSV